MTFKKFLQVGVVCVLASASLSNALAAPVKTILDTPSLENQIVQVIKQNISKEDLIYIVKNARAERNDRTERIYNKINKLITAEYGSNEFDSVKNELNKTLKEVGVDHIKVSYSYAMPKKIMDEVSKDNPEVKTTDSSRADGALDVKSECDVTMNFAIDAKGRLFEPSELVSLSKDQISNMSKQEIMGVLKETLLHEVSHCLLNAQMKDPNFSLKFSDSYAAKNPTIVKHLKEKLLEVQEQIAAKKENVPVLNSMSFINFHESFSDVNAAFARLGEHPTPQTIKEAKEQLLNVARLRESTDLNHQTQYAVQYALTKIDVAAKMNPQERTIFATEIASDSLMNSMKLVLKSGVGSASTGTISSYLVDGIKILDNGLVFEGIPENKMEAYEAIEKEIILMKDSKNVMGTITQELKSHKDLVAEYTKEVSKNAQTENSENIISQEFLASSMNNLTNLRGKFSTISAKYNFTSTKP